MDATNQQQMLTDSDDPTTDHIVTDATPLLATETTAIDDSNLETPETITWSTNILSEKCREGNNKHISYFVDYSRQTKNCKANAIELLDRLDSETNLSPLHHVARYQQLDICFMLLSNFTLMDGVNIKDASDRTPIHFAFRSSIKTRSNGSSSEKPIDLDADLGSEIQDIEAWKEDYTTKIHTVDHPLIYLFAKAKGDLNARDKYLLTPLHYAVAQNNLPGVKQLLFFDVNIEAHDRQGIRPLHLACREGYLPIVEYLIANGATIDATDSEFWTPLHYACARGHLEIIELLRIKNEAVFRQLIQRKTDTGATCVHLAVQHGNRRSVDYILSQFSNETVKRLLREQAAPFGTPLHFAARFCDPSMIKLLFHYQVDPLVFNDQNQSPLHIACASNRLSIVQTLLAYTKSSLLEIKDQHGQTALSLTSNSDIIDELIAVHANLSSIDNDHMNPLMIAVSKSQYAIVEHLLAAIRDYDSQIFEQVEKRKHRSVFLLAVQKGSVDICTALLEHPFIRWDTVDKQRMNAFHLAARYNHQEIIALLGEYIRQTDRFVSMKSRTFSITTRTSESEHVPTGQGFSTLRKYIDAPNEDGKTPLHIAAELGHTLSLKTLLDYGADALLMNYVGQLPLHLAIQNGHASCVDLLLEASSRKPSDFQAALARRQSPLNTACQNGFTDIVRLLLAQQTHDHRAIDFQGMTSDKEANPLEIAIKYRQADTVHALLDHPDLELWLTAVGQTPTDIHQTPLREMIRYMPDCAKHAFDRLISKTNDIDSNGNPTECITYRYQFIDDYFLENDKLYGANRNQIYRHHPFIIALDCEHHGLLQHPLARQLMKRKWKLYRPFFYLTRILTFLLLLTLTFYVLLIPAPISKTPPKFTLKFVDRILPPMRWSILLLASINLFISSFEILLYRGFRVPFAQIFSLISFITALVAFLPLNETKTNIFWQWQLATVSVLFQWFNAAFILRSVPFVGNFIVMFQSILINFFSLIFVILPLLIAFTFSTHMIFYNQLPFKETHLATHKLSAMLIGEFDYHGIFFSKPVLTAAAFIFTPFIFIMAIVFMNLLLGLTIGDIQSCLEDARSKAQSYRIRELIYIEATLPSLSLLKSFITDKQVVEVQKKDLILTKRDQEDEEDSDEEEANTAPAQRHGQLEARKLLDILTMLCRQAKQVLEKEITHERMLKKLLTMHRAQLSAKTSMDGLDTSRQST